MSFFITFGSFFCHRHLPRSAPNSGFNIDYTEVFSSGHPRFSLIRISCSNIFYHFYFGNGVHALTAGECRFQSYFLRASRFVVILYMKGGLEFHPVLVLFIHRV